MSSAGLKGPSIGTRQMMAGSAAVNVAGSAPARPSPGLGLPRRRKSRPAAAPIGGVNHHVLTPYAAARLLGVTIEEIGRVQDEGILPVYDLGGERMVPDDASSRTQSAAG